MARLRPHLTTAGQPGAGSDPHNPPAGQADQSGEILLRAKQPQKVQLAGIERIGTGGVFLHGARCRAGQCASLCGV